MSRKRKHHKREWQYARAVMRHDTGEDGRHTLLAKGWAAGYAAALRDVRKIMHEAGDETYNELSYGEALDAKLDKLLEPKR